jgi:tartrate dehydratase alpha subunit/fumarate hydratase class I-like protein
MASLREIDVGQIQETVARLCQEAATLLPNDVLQALRQARETEESPMARKVLDQILRNAELAGENLLPLCQDTGTAVVFLEIGQDVHVVGGDLNDAITEASAGGTPRATCGPPSRRDRSRPASTPRTTRRPSSTPRSSPATSCTSRCCPRAAAART